MGSSDAAVAQQSTAYEFAAGQLREILAAQGEFQARATDPEDAIAYAPEFGCKIAACEAAAIFTQAKDWFVRRAVSGAPLGEADRVPSTGSLVGECFRSGQVTICQDTGADPRADLVAMHSAGLRSAMAVPLLSSRAIEGVLVLGAAGADAFAAANATFMSVLGGVVGSAIELGAVILRAQKQTDEMWSQLEEANRNAHTHRLLFDENPTPMFIFDPATLEILRANEAALTFYGYDAASFVGASLLMLHAEDERAAIREDIAGGHRSDRSIQFRQFRKDGSARDVIALERAFDLEGRLTRLTIINDITERLSAERLLRLEQIVAASLAHAAGSAAAVAACVEAICDSAGWDCGAFWSLAPDGEKMRCFGAWGAQTPGIDGFLDTTRQMTQTRNSGGLVRRVWQNAAPVWIKDLARDGSFARADAARAAELHTAFAFPVLSGTVVIGVLEFYSRVMRPPDADLLQCSRTIGSQIGQFYQRTEAQERLRESEERYQDTIELAPIGIAHVDVELRFIHVNRWMCDLLGYTREELLARTVRDVSHPEDVHVTDAMRARMHAGEINSFQIEKRYLRKDGETVWAALTIALKRDAAGQPLHYISVIEDITARKRAEEQLAATQNQLMQADKMSSVGQLAAGVAHEINNPIGYVYSNLGTLGKYIDELMGMLDTYGAAENELPAASPALAALQRRKEQLDLAFLREDVTALMSESREGITRVKKIVQDLKDFSHADTKDEWQTAELHKGLESTLNIAHNEFKYKANVIKEYGELPEIRCLPSQLNQVFMNLMVNAAHAIKDKGTITLRTGLRGEEVWVEISDTGDGIPKEDLKRIFDPFFTTKPIGKGTGLGLSLSYGIVKKHGGRIEVDSEVGKGTTFRILLPRRPPGAAA
ncbi:MAG: PAS domain S-box protein [Burkholderiales bacterium]